MLLLYCYCFSWFLFHEFSFIQFLISLLLFFGSKLALSQLFDMTLARGNDVIVNIDRPLNKSHIVACAILQGSVDEAQIKSQIKNNLYKFPEYAKLRKILKRFFFLYFWGSNPFFNFDNHIEFLRKPFKSQRELDDFMAFHASEGTFEINPKWKIFILTSVFENKSAFIMKIHHSIGDGASIMSLILNICSCDEFESIKLPKFSSLQWLILMPIGLLSTFKTLLSLIVNFFFYRKARKEKNDFSGKKLDGVKAGSSSIAIPIQNIKSLSKDASFNELVFTIFNCSLRNVHRNKYNKEIEKLPILLAASLRTYPNPGIPLELTNLTNFLRIAHFPKGSFEQTLTQYKILFKILKKSYDFYYNQFFVDALFTILPLSIMLWTTDMYMETNPFILTSVPGPIKKIKLFGMDVDDLRFLANSPGYTNAVFNVLTYNGNVVFGCFADTSTGIDCREVIRNIETIVQEGNYCKIEDFKKNI